MSRPPRNTSESNPVDVWIDIPATPLSMGIADAWRIPDCWRQDEKWVHRYRNEVVELDASHLTHWIRPPRPPRNGKVGR